LVTGETTGSNYDFGLVRYNEDGSLDSTFDFDGKVRTPIGTQNDYANAILIQPDGKIVVAGRSNNITYIDYVIVRYNTNGSLDSTFDFDGIALLSMGVTGLDCQAVSLQNDGKVVIVGSVYNGTDMDFMVARFNTNGLIDSTYDGDGIATVSIGLGDDYCAAAVIQPDDKMVLAGYSFNGVSSDYALVRFNENGSLDTSFSSDGKLTTSITTSGEGAFAVVLQPDGKILAAGGSSSGSNLNFSSIRYNTDGDLDTSYSSDGKLITDLGSNEDQCSGAWIQSDGKIILAGVTGDYPNVNFGLVRYNYNGSLDASFGTNGIVITDIPGSVETARAVTVQTDGKILVGGEVWTGIGYDDMVLVRYIGYCDNSISQFGDTLEADANGATYQWINCLSGNASIPGETNQYFLPTTNGSYAVIITENSCSDTSECFVLNNLNINDYPFENRIALFPNPAKTWVNIQSQLPIEKNEILNTQGSLIKTTFDNVGFSVQNLSDGMYYSRIYFAGNSVPITKKILVTK